MYRVLCTVYGVPCIIRLRTMVLCIVYCVSCTVYRVLCSVYCGGLQRCAKLTNHRFLLIYHGNDPPVPLLPDTIHQYAVVLLFHTEWPEPLVVLSNILQGINLDIPTVGPACLGLPFDFYSKLIFATLVTLLVILAPLNWLMLRRKMCKKQESKQELARATRLMLGDMIIIILLVHPGLSGLAIQVFRCDEFKSPRSTGTSATGNV